MPDLTLRRPASSAGGSVGCAVADRPLVATACRARTSLLLGGRPPAITTTQKSDRTDSCQSTAGSVIAARLRAIFSSETAADIGGHDCPLGDVVADRIGSAEPEHDVPHDHLGPPAIETISRSSLWDLKNKSPANRGRSKTDALPVAIHHRIVHSG